MTTVTVAQYRLPADAVVAAEIIRDLAPLVAATRAEPGNRGIEVIQEDADPARLVLVERWADPAALAAHRSTAHFIDGIIGSIAPRLIGREVVIGTAMDLVTGSAQSAGAADDESSAAAAE